MTLPSVAQTRSAHSEQVGESGQPVPHNALALWGIVLLGALLRLVTLGHKSFWLDEIASVGIARLPGPVFRHVLLHNEGNMALYYLLLKPWLRLGYGEAMVRLLSVIPGILSVPFVYLLGKRLFGREIGIVAALFLALNTCAVSVSQEARSYSFVALGAVLSTYLFARLIERPSYSSALGYALAAGLTCYFHYFGVLVPAAHGLSVVAFRSQRRHWRPLFLACAVVVLLASPVLWLMHTQDAGHISWVQRPSWLELYHLGVFLAAAGGKTVGAILLAVELVLAGFFIAAFRRVWRGADDLLRWRYALTASVVVTPIVITLLVSLARPVFYHRFLIICLPGWLLMIAVGAVQLPVRAWRSAAIVGVCLLSLATTAIFYRRTTEDWRGAVNYLIANTRPDDRVLYYQLVAKYAGEDYRSWSQPPDAARPQSTGIGPGNTDWQHDIEHVRRVWLVLYRAKHQDAQVRAIEEEVSKRYAITSEREFQGFTVTEYDRR